MSCVWLTVHDVARHLQVHHTTVRRWLQTGQLKGYKPGTMRDWRVCLEELNEFAKGTSAGRRATVKRHVREALTDD